MLNGRALVIVNNIDAKPEKFMVCRIFQNKLWYYGSWDNEDQANEIAKMLDGIVVERMD